MSAFAYMKKMDELFDELVEAGANEGFVHEWMDQMDDLAEFSENDDPAPAHLQPTVEGFALWLEGK